MNGMSNSKQFGYQVPNTVGPDFSIPGQQQYSHNTVSSQGYPQGSHPKLFGESQFKNGFGPVYAVPSQPWQHDNSPHAVTSSGQQSHAQMMGVGHWQQVGSSHQAMPVYYMCPYCICPSFVKGRLPGCQQ